MSSNERPPNQTPSRLTKYAVCLILPLTPSLSYFYVCVYVLYAMYVGYVISPCSSTCPTAVILGIRSLGILGTGSELEPHHPKMDPAWRSGDRTKRERGGVVVAIKSTLV